MLTYTEATTTLGCKTSRESCPSWLYINLHNTGDNYNYGYWASAAYASSSSNAHGVYSLGYVSNSAANASYGLRPVIELTK